MPPPAFTPQGDPIWPRRSSLDSNSLPHVLVALETCDDPRYARRRELVETTWAKRLPANFDFFIATGAALGVPDDYRSLCLKTRAIVQFALRSGYDWLLKVDDDVYVRTERLRVPGTDYCGLFLGDDVSEVWCSGGFYWLSRNAMQTVARAPFNPDLAPSAEDRWVGWALRHVGIHPWPYPVALKPCPCGLCKPKSAPAGWTAYIIDPKYDEAEFLEFERLYAPV